jgi:putative phage-type endonuclease
MSIPKISLAEIEEAHKTGIGGSEAGTIAGINPYKTPLDLYMEKKGLVEPEEPSEAMLWGLLLEPVIAEEYARRTGYKLVCPGRTLRHQEHVWMIGHLDAVASDNGNPIGLECKTTGQFSAKLWGEPGTDQIPEAYILQVQHYMAITGFAMFDVAVLIGGRDFRIYRVHRDEELIKRLIEMEADFWRRVQEGDPPEIDHSPGAKKLLASKYPKDTGKELIATDQIVPIVAELQDVRGKIDKLEMVKDSCENRIKSYMGEASALLGEGFKITWKATKDSEAIDYKGLLTELNPKPELVKRFTTIKPGVRRFLAKFEEED